VNESPPVRLILGLVVFFSCLFCLLYLSFTGSFYPDELNYVGVFSSETAGTEYFIGVYPIVEKKTLGIVLTEWGDYHNQSRSIMIVPVDAENISFLKMDEKKDVQYPDKIAESMDAVRIPYEKYENLSLVKENNGVLVVKPDHIKGYYGIEFYAPGWIQQTSSSQVSIVIPLYAAGSEISSEVSQISRYRIQVSIPKNYELISSVPSPTRFKVTGNNLAVYQFDMNATDSDLMINLENRFITRDNNNLKILLGTILGSAMMFSITTAIEIIRRREEIFKRKKQTGK
jgi:hypothetical protein